MLTAAELETAALSLEQPMKDLQMRIMLDIIRRIQINGEITAAADWQIHRLQQLGMSKREIKKYIKDALTLTAKEVNHLYKDVLRRGYARDESLYRFKGKPFIPFEENAGLQQLISTVSEQTAGTLQNITQSMGFAVKQPDGALEFLPTADYYQQTLDRAMLDIASGAFDYHAVLKRTVSEMVQSQIRTVDYASGTSRNIVSASRTAIMTGLSQVTARINEDNAAALETDTYEVTWHGGARPEHQIWQGKWWTHEELRSVCGLGSVTGLCGASCYHDYFPVIPGISEPTYTAEELERMNREENTPVYYDPTGKPYTKYEALQRQRRLEGAMRKQRQKIRLLEEGGAEENDILAARARYRGTSQEYTAFSEAMSLPQQRERVTADGLGDVRKFAKKVDISGGSGIIELRGNDSIYHEVTDKSIENVPKLELFETDDLNTLHQKASRDLLNEVSKQKPVGTEVSIVYDADMQPIEGYGYRIGKVGTVGVDDPGVPFRVLHNHGSGETFSLADLSCLTENENMLSLSAIGNTGSAYSILRTAASDSKGYRVFLRNKSKEVIYSANGTDFTLEMLGDKSRGELTAESISKLNSAQIKELKAAMVKQSEACAKGGVDYGFQYSFSKTGVADG